MTGSRSVFIFVSIFFFSLLSSADAAMEIQWWHAMSGNLGETVKRLAKTFNEGQDQYTVVPVYKGNYAETMTAGIAAFRSRQPPHILQVFEVGTATMMAAQRAIKPVHEVMAASGTDFDPKHFLPAVTGYYTSPDGKMLSMPFNSSTPILYYNKDAFRKAGLDPEKPPATWPQLADHARKLLQAGYQCGFSSAWISWIHIENLGAWHNVPLGTRDNGFESMDARLTLNGPLHVNHLAHLAKWQKEKIFVYGGRRNLGNAKFTSGKCPMYTESSAGYAGFKQNAKFELGAGMLPFWPGGSGAPQNSIIGGASLWVMAGHSEAAYRGVGQFFAFLSSPAVQADWHQSTGYLPITQAAYDLTKKSGYYQKNPIAETALHQLTLNPPTKNSRGLRFGHMVRLRDIIYNEIESVLAGRKSAKQGLNTVVKTGNRLLKKFARTNRQR